MVCPDQVFGALSDVSTERQLADKVRTYGRRGKVATRLEALGESATSSVDTMAFISMSIYMIGYFTHSTSGVSPLIFTTLCSIYPGQLLRREIGT